MSNIFKFKQFSINQSNAPFKIGTDGVLLGAWCSENYTKPKYILDIGTGTGVIALMLAQRFQMAAINAIEINSTAAKIAKENFNTSPWARRIQFTETSLQNFSPDTPFDLIVCNPPFFVNSEKSGNHAKDTARHTLELDFEDILHFASKKLMQNGVLSLILPADRKEELQNLADSFDLYATQICEVFPTPQSKPKRILIEFGKEENESKTSSLIIEQSGRHQYSAKYIGLTKDFAEFKPQ